MATLAKTTRSTTHTLASATAGPFLVGYRLFDDDAVEVYVNGVVSAAWSLSRTYVNGYDDNASITFNLPLAPGDVVVIQTMLKPVRSANYTPGDPSLTANLNIELARLWSAVADHDREIRRSPRILNVVQDKIAPVTGKALIFGPGGQLTPGDLLSGGVAVSAFGEDLVAAADADAAKTLLGIDDSTASVEVAAYGAVGDGVTDDVAAIEAADAALQKGGTLVFGTNKTYLAGSTINIQNAGRLEMNGSTIKGTSAVTSQLVAWQKQIAAYAAGADYTAFSTVERAVTFTIPAGVTLAAGNVVRLMSDTVRVTGYNHGMLATVVSVAGGVATLNTPFYAAFQVDDIDVWEGFAQMEVVNGTFDITASPAAQGFYEALLIRGSNARVRNCTFLGNEYAGIGVRVQTDGAMIEGCKAYGFLNSQGLPDGGRIGYGFAVHGNNSVIRNCLAYNCKHGLASASREVVALNITYQDCQVYEDPNATASLYTGSIDIHYNALGALLVENCRVIGQSRLLALRAPGVIVRGGTYIQTAAGGQLFETFEGPYDSILIEDVAYGLGDSTSAFFRIQSSMAAAVTGFSNVTMRNCRSLGAVGRIVEITRASTITRMTIEDCWHRGGSIIRTEGGSIEDLTIRGCDNTTLEGSIRLNLDGASQYIDDLEITGNKLRRFVGTSSENVILIQSSSSTRLPLRRSRIEANGFEHSGDSSIGYAIQIRKVAATLLAMSRNRISRGAAQCIQIDGCSVIRAVMDGNVLDGSFLFTNADLATVLTDVTITGNGGATYIVNVDANGVTKTRYVQTGNNFATFTP